jgi:hypothetical protein
MEVFLMAASMLQVPLLGWRHLLGIASVLVEI